MIGVSVAVIPKRGFAFALTATIATMLAASAPSLFYPDIAESLYRALAPYSGMMATNGTIDSGPVDLRLGALARVSGNPTLARQHLRSAQLMCRRIDARVWADQASQLIVAL